MRLVHRMLGPALLLGAAGYLRLRWDEVPERWIVHWGPGGMPDGFAVRSPASAAAPLVFGLVLWGVLQGVGAVAARMSNAQLWREPLSRATSGMLNDLAIAICGTSGFIAVSFPLGPHLSPGWLVALTLGATVASIVVGHRRYAAAMAEVKKRDDAPNLEGYRGAFYANAKDERLWAPKLSGLGMTINFAHAWAWPIVLLAVGIPVGVAIFVAACVRAP